MHNKNHTSHKVNIVVCIEFADTHFAQKDFRFTKMAVIELSSGRTPQISSIHTINGVNNPMESTAEITDMPHPLEHSVDIDITRTKTKY